MTAVLELPVLVLNRFWQPVHTCSARRAVHLLCLGHAQVVQVDGEERFNTHDLGSWIRHSRGVIGEELIHGPRVALRVPKIVVLAIYDKLPRLEVKFTRRNVFLRDKFTCQYCSKVLPEHQLNLDHVLPRDKGGRTTWENIVTSCVRCNTRKANKLTHEVNMHPLRKPIAPRWRPLFGLHENGLADESWAHFVNHVRGDEKMSA
jgi:5-methylcytosine-specific restriction endonuclease McrA